MRRLLALALLTAAACVPADGALPTGSAEFTIFTKDEELFIPAERLTRRLRNWNVHFERIRVSFKTMTIGKVGVPEQCSYRGRGARSNVIFDLSRGNIQTFNGIQPGDCPDVGIVFGLPDLATTLGEGMTVDDIGAMLAPPASHVIIEGRATPKDPDDEITRPYRFLLRFDPERTTTTFGGCRSEVFRRGVRILPEQRQQARVTFNPVAVLHLGIGGSPSFEHFAIADDEGNGDGIVTLEELDRLTIQRCREIALGVSDACLFKERERTGTFGDFVRDQLRDTMRFNDVGPCNGNPPGVE